MIKTGCEQTVTQAIVDNSQPHLKVKAHLISFILTTLKHIHHPIPAKLNLKSMLSSLSQQ